MVHYSKQNNTIPIYIKSRSKIGGGRIDIFYNPGVFVSIKPSEIRSIMYQTLNYLDRKFDGSPRPTALPCSSPKPDLSDCRTGYGGNTTSRQIAFLVSKLT